MTFKIFMTISLPFVILWAILHRVWIEIKDIPFYIRCDVGMEISYYKLIMRK